MMGLLAKKVLLMHVCVRACGCFACSATFLAFPPNLEFRFPVIFEQLHFLLSVRISRLSFSIHPSMSWSISKNPRRGSFSEKAQ